MSLASISMVRPKEHPYYTAVDKRAQLTVEMRESREVGELFMGDIRMARTRKTRGLSPSMYIS